MQKFHINDRLWQTKRKDYWKDFNIVEDLEPTAVKNIKKYKDNNLDNNIYNWQGFKGKGQVNIKNRKKFVK